MNRWLSSALILGLALVGVASADTVVLKNGRSIPAKSVTEEKGRVYVDHGCGKISLPRSHVARIERDEVATTTSRSR